jgi:hypothetical protein
MSALSKFLVLLALVLLASHANSFTSLSWVAGNQVRINHLTRLQPMSDPTNEPSHEPIREPTNRMDLCFQTTFHKSTMLCSLITATNMNL